MMKIVISYRCIWILMIAMAITNILVSQQTFKVVKPTQPISTRNTISVGVDNGISLNTISVSEVNPNIQPKFSHYIGLTYEHRISPVVSIQPSLYRSRMGFETVDPINQSKTPVDFEYIGVSILGGLRMGDDPLSWIVQSGPSFSYMTHYNQGSDIWIDRNLLHKNRYGVVWRTGFSHKRGPIELKALLTGDYALTSMDRSEAPFSFSLSQLSFLINLSYYVR